MANALSTGDSVAAAAVFASLFTLLTFANIFRLFQRRAWFCVPFTIGGIMETTGYISRALGSSNPTSTALKIVQVLCILLAPVLFAATIYMTLGRVVRATDGETYSLLRSTWITKIFVSGDIVCFVTQAIGAGVIAAGGTASLGGDIVLAGLVMQIVVFGFFVCVGVRFHLRLRRQPTAQSETFRWERHMVAMYIMSAAITSRNIYRVVEYCMGADGYIMRHEWTLYVFDAAMMVFVLSVSMRCYSLFKESAGSGKIMHEIAMEVYTRFSA
ncbi:hypothetical protein LTR37_017515 [Vermiconidia calcicola]|uniref:Uncharacterized protein n=1 Tax=Vermiconidia calcicola TaxID=1690605 RepID=A0ACC3MLF0_9PEZI|nr:hypothetical protein LTR37_017515 [Vermiconidia calcicola]